MRPYNYPLHAQARFSQNLMEQGSHPTSERLLAVLRPCNAEVATALGIHEGDTVIHLRTLRRVNGVPVCVINHYLPDLSWWPQLQQFSHGSLHDFIRLHLTAGLTRKQTRSPRAGRRQKRAACCRFPARAAALGAHSEHLYRQRQHGGILRQPDACRHD